MCLSQENKQNNSGTVVNRARINVGRRKAISLSEREIFPKIFIIFLFKFRKKTEGIGQAFQQIRKPALARRPQYIPAIDITFWGQLFNKL